ncbi:MAG: PQQ-dependent sugar dehydrogenase [Candidatus Binatia bacterium]
MKTVAFAGGIAVWLVLGAVASGAAAAAELRSVDTQQGPIAAETLASGLNHPWGMAFLPDGRLLVTERAGALRLLATDRRLSPPLGGVPKVFHRGQGGLLDVALDPQFASSSLVYLSYAEPGEGGASTALGRGRLAGDKLEHFEVIFRQQPKVDGPNHFGGRVVFAGDGLLFLTLGERFKFEPAQDLRNHLGKIVRIRADGSVPADNPFVGRSDVKPEIWTYGHRNIESAAIEPQSNALWVAEMGPLGGDELNLIEPGKNYGWPLVSWGKHYDGRDIPDPPSRPDLTDAVKHWTPVISPSGMIFYTGEMFPRWRDSMFIGGLSAGGLVRLTFENGRPVAEERISLGTRIRDVEQAPDGSIYVLTDEDDGDILRLSAAR